MKILKGILYVILAIILLIVLIGFVLPKRYEVSQSITVKKSPEVVYYHSMNLDERGNWDPWIAEEPEAQIKTDMTEEGVGSTWQWKGEKIGSGKITIDEVDIHERIQSTLQFFEPDTSSAQVEWIFEPSEQGTHIFWSMSGEWSNIPERWIGLIIKSSIRESFQKGLQNYKQYLEELPEVPGKTSDLQKVTTQPLKAMVYKTSATMDQMQTKMGEAFGKLMTYCNEQGIKPASAPYAMYYEYDPDQQTVFEVGIPVQEKCKETEEITFKQIPEQKAVMAKHTGAYESIYITYNTIQKFMNEQNLKISGPPWEVYLTDPDRVKDQSKWETLVYFPFSGHSKSQ